MQWLDFLKNVWKKKNSAQEKLRKKFSINGIIENLREKNADLKDLYD